MLGEPLAALGETADKIGYVAFWWIHIGLVFGLLVYIPLSKHFHVFISPFNVFLKTTGPKGELKKIENIEEAETFGVSKVMQFTWKDILDGYACTECGRCTSACPAKLSDKPLDPKKIIVDMKLATYAHGGLHMLARDERSRSITAETPLIGGLITEEELWSCTTCMACVEACPVGDRAGAEDRRHAPLAGVGGDRVPGRADADVQQSGAQWQPVRLPRQTRALPGPRASG